MRRLTWLTICGCVILSLFFIPQQRGGAQTAKATARLLYTIPETITHVWSPDNQTLAVYHLDVSLYDAATGKVRAQVKYEGPLLPNNIYFTPDSKTLVIHSDRVRLYSAADGKLLRQFGDGTTPINYYERYYKTEIISGYGTGIEDQNEYKYEVKEPTAFENTQELPALYPSDRFISPDSKLLMTRGTAGAAEVYDLSTGELRFTLEPFVAPGKKRNKKAKALGEFSPDSKFIVTSHGDLTPRLWNADTGKLIADLAPQSDIVFGVRFSSDSRFVLTNTLSDGIIKIWETATGKLLHTVGTKKDGQWFAVWNPRNNTFVTKSTKTDQWQINIWNAETGALVTKLDGKAINEKFDWNLTFVYSPDGRILLTQAKNKYYVFSSIVPNTKLRLIAHLWNAESGALITSLRDTKKRDGDAYWYDKFFWNPAGDVLVTTGVTVKLWSRSGELLQEIDANAETWASLSPDGKLLAVMPGLSLGKDLRVLAAGMGSLLTGKMPKVKPFKISVWKLEG